MPAARPAPQRQDRGPSEDGAYERSFIDVARAPDACQLVAQDSDLDVLVVWRGTETDQHEDPPYKEKGKSRGHAGHPGRCPSRLLRAVIVYLHPSGSGEICEGSLVERYTSCGNPNCRCAAS